MFIKEKFFLDHIIQKIYDTQNEFCIFETLKTDEENFLSYFFIFPEDTLILYNPKEIFHFFSRIENYLSRGYFVAGFFSYELGYFLDFKYKFNIRDFNFPLAYFYIFKEPFIFNHKEKKFFGNLKNLKYLLDIKTTTKDIKFEIKSLHLNISYQEYINSIEKIKKYISLGDTYQVNYTIKTKFDVKGSLLGLYYQLKQNQKVSYCAFIKTPQYVIISLSPELFFKKEYNIIITKPMKGTICRGKNIFEDEIQIKKLYNSKKNCAENVMIVDLLRNDLGKISSYGEVFVDKLFEIEKYETLFQMTSKIQAKINPNIKFYNIFYAIFPSGSVTGAPKIKTMQIINELEKEPRKIYTGAVGFFKPNKDAIFNVAIRTILIEKENKAELGVGSGIVSDSLAEKEFEECRLKSMFLIKKTKEFKLIETILYVSNFDIKIKKFDNLNLNIDYRKFKNGYFLLEYHLERLKNSALYFDFKFNIEKILEKLVNFKNSGCYKVRLLLSKNGDVKIEKLKFNIFEFCSKKVSKITISDNLIDKENIFLYHKTTNRNFYNTEYNKYKSNFFDVLFRNQEGEITETSKCNIFIKLNNNYYTSDVRCGLLNGTFKEYLIKYNRDKIKQKVLLLKDLLSAEKIFITNSVIGIREVRLFLNN